MKGSTLNKPSPAKTPDKGFSLIVTITMLILLSLIAVGLLSLSSSVVRSASNGAEMAEARANARLALNIAIGELQKQAGLDTRVTARADVLSGNVANPRYTGVWESWPVDPNSPPGSSDYNESGKEGRLLTWLASGAPVNGQVDNNFAKQSLNDDVVMWGEGSLGSQAQLTDIVRATRVPIGVESEGGFAWAIMDEGVKARVNTLVGDRNQTTGDRLAQLGTGVRAAVETIDELNGMRAESFEFGSVDSEVMSKAVSFGNFELAGEQLSGANPVTIKSLFHDVSLFSAGLLTDTANGGLRTDFNLMIAQADENLSAGSALPQLYSHASGDYADIAGQGIYESLLGIPNTDGTADPSWNPLFQFARLHEDKVSVVDGAPQIQTQIPETWEAATLQRTRAGTSFQVNTDPTDELVLMPTIAKVQMIFSLVGRDLYRQGRFSPGGAPPAATASQSGDMHNPQAGFFRGTDFGYDIQLLYTPVVVLHNPYSTALEFRDMSVEFHHIPFAMQIFRNGAPQSRDLVPFETMFADNDVEGGDKVFGMTLKTNQRDRPGSTTFKMLPGEVLLFSPYLSPRTSYQSNFNGDRVNWDIYVRDQKTANLEAMPGWRGDGIGFSCDWLAGNLTLAEDKSQGRWRSCFGLSPDDQISVRMAPFSTPSSNNKFLVTMSATPPRGSSPKVVNAIEINYGTEENLRETILGDEDGFLTYPEEGTVEGRDLIDWSGTSIADMANVKPIAMVSLQAKTTFGGLGTGEQVDGRVAAKPFAFAHGSVGASSASLTAEHPSAHSHEIDLQALTLAEGTTSIIEVDDGTGRGNFITGHSSFNGKKFGVAYEIPLTPLQSLSTLNGANPGGSTAFLPRFAAPIGNSWAHPLMRRSSIQETAPLGYPMYDHSYLLNLAFYDRFYFSGLGSQTGPYGNGLTTQSALEQFGDQGFLNDQRLSLYVPEDSQASDLQELASDQLAHEKIAGWQMMNGAFNINSTSVKAWKALLFSTYAPEAQMFELSPENKSSSLDALGSVGTGTTRISRLRVPLSQSFEGGGRPDLAYWTGPREYDEQDIERLAEEIVEQVKLRGPFLSLSEFVNRQIGDDQLALQGALQAAIDASGLNNDLGQAAIAGDNIGQGEVANYRYRNTDAATGPSYQGATGFLTQADLLGVLGNAATARSDTFTVRGYGEARNRAGRVQATAVCEAVVQRFPDWLDSQDPIEAKPGDLNSAVNQNFGRRFRMVSFRWLSEEEV